MSSSNLQLDSDPNAADSEPNGTDSESADSTETNAPSPIAVRRRFMSGLSLPIAVFLLIVLLANLNWFYLHAIVDTFGNFQHQWIVLLACLAVYQLFRKRFLWATAIVVLTAWPAYHVGQLYIAPESIAGGPVKVKMLTINVLFENTSYQGVLDLVEERQPDVLSLIEYDEFWFKNLDGKLPDYPYRIGPRYGNVMYSKFPIQEVKDSPILVPCSCGGIGWVGDQQVLFWLVHTSSPTSPYRLRQRDSQIANVQAKLNSQSYYRHVVVAGDFNATTNSVSIDRLLKVANLRDSRKGFGLQNSWPIWCPPLSICIDHVFVSPKVKVHQRQTEESIGSDHRPVFCELSFGKHGRPGSANAIQALNKSVPNRFAKDP